MKWLDPKTNPIPTDIEDFLAIIFHPSDEACGDKVVVYVHQDTFYHPKEKYRNLFTPTFSIFLDQDEIISWMPLPELPEPPKL